MLRGGSYSKRSYVPQELKLLKIILRLILEHIALNQYSMYARSCFSKCQLKYCYLACDRGSSFKDIVIGMRLIYVIYRPKTTFD
jgi:hypothetical protein